MVKRWLSLALVLVVVATMVSCTGPSGGSSTGSPASVVKKFYAALNEGNLSKAQGFLGPTMGDLEYSDLGELAKMGKLAGSFEKIDILGEEKGKELGEEYAYVTVEVTLSPAGQSNLGFQAGTWGGKRTLLLEKFESGWKITYIR